MLPVGKNLISFTGRSLLRGGMRRELSSAPQKDFVYQELFDLKSNPDKTTKYRKLFDGKYVETMDVDGQKFLKIMSFLL